MPDNPIVWIVAIVAGAAVVLFALWKGQMVEVELKPLRLRFKRAGEAGGGVSVGEGLTVDKAKTGDIAGVKGTGTTAPVGSVSVAKGARITGSTTGDIVGVKQTGTEEKKP